MQCILPLAFVVVHRFMVDSIIIVIILTLVFGILEEEEEVFPQPDPEPQPQPEPKIGNMNSGGKFYYTTNVNLTLIKFLGMFNVHNIQARSWGGGGGARPPFVQKYGAQSKYS